ncbi:MAG TPA: deoxyribonuclease IV, partial [Candidatus Eremiobacteraceae bacterium]|nr:deoxyribonuclease IV [Candidatus Eremiobacteraceae bacterium]
YDTVAWTRFKEQRRASGIFPTVIHTSYLVNLATDNKTLRSLSEKLVANDLAVAGRAGIEYVNTHLGSYGTLDRSVGMARICDAVARLVKNAPPGPMLLLENSAGAGNNSGGTIEELGAIMKAARSKRVGVCLDTAHAWASGYDLSTPSGVKNFLVLVDKHIGIGAVRALHLNDTEVELGGRRDRHWHVGKGRIGEAGFKALLRTKALDHAACVCETPKSPELDRENLVTVRRLAGAKPPKRKPLKLP